MPLTPTAASYATALESIVAAINADPGLTSHVSAADLAAGIAATRSLNELLATVIDQLGVNADRVITPEELMAVSDAIRANPAYYDQFITAHGDDEWNMETGYHLLQNDGGLLTFQGRKLIDTVLDAIFHIGFIYFDGRFVNEDGNANEQVADVAGWLNFFLNGENRVFGTLGDDTLYSGDYSSVMSLAANEIFEAGDGDDQIWAGAGDDTVLAGDGDDKSGGGGGNDTMRGGNGSDQLWGEGGGDRIFGEAGDDVLGGGMGNDVINGGIGNDEISGQEGKDRLDGGDGDDIMGGGIGNDTMNGDAGLDTLWGDSGDDLMDGGAGNDTIGGGIGNDTILGGEDSDMLYGDDGADQIDGGTGIDHLSGGNGNDVLKGGSGDDKLTGGEGADILRGGAGADKIYLWDNDDAMDTILIEAGDSGLTRATIDRIEGFESGQDVIDLRSFGPMSFADLDYVGGGQASVYFDGNYLRIDSNGDRASDLIIQFAWVDELVASDFLFA